ncbi:hypothetical protein [Mesorhizobium xinjiangense]|uniref:hypothetical protein n=1 Tax=Mesorhizobium xinjiangense TaxID=2678685 RepID=UPI001F2A004D|nr:hypothetical protein [Mesorhizobium xinjiangense]
MILALGFGMFALPAAGQTQLALSEIKTPEVPSGEEVSDDPAEKSEPETGVPMPDPVERAPLPAPEMEVPDDGQPGEGDPADLPHVDLDEPLPEVIHDLSRLPEPTRRMRQLIIEACRKGDLEGLRPLIGMGASATQLSLGGIEGDPIDFLHEISGDGDGQEILAILLEVLEAGFVHLEAGTPNEVYVWPYFFAVPLERLDAPQRVELFKIVTAGDYQDMKTYGAYNFYRAGITPDGEWVFFVAGD